LHPANSGKLFVKPASRKSLFCQVFSKDFLGGFVRYQLLMQRKKPFSRNSLFSKLLTPADPPPVPFSRGFRNARRRSREVKRSGT
jgi:hypothetical protein